MEPADNDAAEIESLLEQTRDDGDDVVGLLLRARVRAGVLERTSEPPRIGRFVVSSRLGAGATGTVLRAYDPVLERSVAIKVLHGVHASDRELVLHEARSLARFTHPHAIAVYEVDEAPVGPFVVMQLATGGSVHDRPSDGVRAWRTIIDELLPVADALAAAHRAGVVHGDVKPQNILCADHGLCIADFGLARIADAHTDGQGGGTPGYLAPERCRGGGPSAAADQFAFVVSVVELVAGRRPSADDRLDDLRAAGVSGRVLEALRRGLAADPADRFASIDALAGALRAARRSPRWMPALIAAGPLVAVVIFAGRGGADARCDAGARTVAAVWQDDRARAIEAAFERVVPGRGATLASSTNAAIAAAGDAWARAHREVCEATWVSGQQSDALHDARMQCLERRLAELDAVISELERASDPSEIAAARDAVDATAGVDRCTAARVHRPPEPPPADVARASEIQDGIDRAWASYHLGRYAAARDGAAHRLDDAIALGHAPLQLAARVVLGAAQARIDEASIAESTLSTAYLEATEQGDDATAADVAVLLLRSSTFSGALDRVLAQESFVRSALRRTGQPEAEVDGLVGEARLEAGDTQAATAALTSALAAETRAARRPILHALLGSAALARDEPDQALREFERALELAVAHWGADHPTIGFFLQRLGRGQRARGDLALALGTLRRALVLREAVLGPDDRAVASTLADLADVEHDLGQRDAAREHLQRSLTIRQAEYGPDHLRLAPLHRRLGDLAQERGAYDDAIAEYGIALAIRRAKTPSHPEVAQLAAKLEAVRAEADAAAALPSGASR